MKPRFFWTAAFNLLRNIKLSPAVELWICVAGIITIVYIILVSAAGQ
jgi:hypothetical protein